MEDPVRVEVVNAIENLKEQRLDHAFWYLDRGFLSCLDGSVVLDNVLREREREGERDEAPFLE